MKLKSILAAAVLAAALVSCNDKGDTTQPLIELVNPAEGSAFARGSEMCVFMHLSDDTALESFKINIHNNFNGHSHGSKAEDHDHEDFNHDTANAFKYNETSETLDGYSISGLVNTSPDVDIEIPVDASYGDYHIMVYCYDAAGNESYVARSFQITEDGKPHLHDHQ